jgi:multiple antibiotic resistance protein
MLLDILRPYFASFTFIYIAIDITGKISTFLAITEKFSFKQRRKLIRHSVIGALILTLGFIYIGKNLMLWIGITASDFKIAGGLLLLLIAINLLISKKKAFAERRKSPRMGIIPLATPLLATPALFIVSLINLDRFGSIATLSMLILNLGLAWLALEKFHFFVKLMGDRGINLLSKIRQGLFEIIPK